MRCLFAVNALYIRYLCVHLRRNKDQTTNKLNTKTETIMAQIKDIFGAGISGKLNQVVFYQRKGKTFVRALPIRKNKPCSPAQLLNKQRFGAMLRFSQLFKYVVIPQIWNQASRTLTGKQLFMKTNKGAFDGEGNITDPKKIQLSIGKLHLPQELVVKPTEEGSTRMNVSWYPDFGGGDLAWWDELMVIALGEGMYSDIKATAIRRGENAGQFELPELKAPISHLYLFFGSLDKRHYSESLCFEVAALN